MNEAIVVDENQTQISSDDMKQVIVLYDDILQNISFVNKYAREDPPWGTGFKRAFTYLIKDLRMFDSVCDNHENFKVIVSMFDAFDRIIIRTHGNGDKVNIKNVSSVAASMVSKLLFANAATVEPLLVDYYPKLLEKINKNKK